MYKAHAQRHTDKHTHTLGMCVVVGTGFLQIWEKVIKKDKRKLVSEKAGESQLICGRQSFCC